MIKENTNINLMAPVGSYESLMAAIQGGADSVYFGIEQLNMRARSSNNFTINDLEEITRVCRQNNIQSYLTLNTIIYDNELPLMRQIADAAKANGVSAIIASDISVLEYARSIDLEVHISTQVNISNTEALRFYARFADVMVLARELTLKQIAHISENIEKEQIKGPSGNLVAIELFVHGALCMAVSGKCYLSLHEQNYSANRGTCLQTCRKGYIVSERESGYELEIDNEYIMSPKDLCTIGFVDKLIKAGVSVFKIEGRARPPEYVKTVVSCYKEAIESVNNGTYTFEKAETWKQKSRTVFNRGFWDGYYLGQKLGEWNKQYGSKAIKRKRYIGKGMNYFSKLGVAEFLLEAGNLSVGDEILITGPTTGVIEIIVTEIRVDLKNVNHARKGDTISTPVANKVRRADKLYKLIPADEMKIQ